MKKIASLALLLFCGGISAQTINLNDPLPEDTRFKKGVLPNGLTYYIHSTDVTKDVASYYIIQNVGSVLENDDQQGLAHFLEHMAFNGTENFEGKGILNTMQKHGLVFGRDINAYTSFDETVYNVNNIPTTPELIDTGLLILHDWCNYLSLIGEEIDAERGVIKEEWRTRQNGGMRILQKTLPTLFNNTQYASRLPIGLMDIVDNFEYKALRDFYHDWYRTDLQAIAIIGDVDVAEIEKKIIEQFSKIPAVQNPIERVVTKVPDNEAMLFDMAMDDEVATSSMSFAVRHDNSLTDETVADLKDMLVTNMATSMISTRIREISQDPEALFVSASVGYYGGYARLHKSLNVNISPKPNQQKAAFKDVLTELIRAVKFGYTTPEINRVKAQYSNFYANQAAKKDDESHRSIIRTIQTNYLENTHITDIEKANVIINAIFENLTAEDIHSKIKELYTKKNRSLIVTGVKGRENMTKEDALSIIDVVENDNGITAYIEDEQLKSLMSGANLTAGTIVESAVDSAINLTTFTLSNGVKVHYKFADKNKNVVKLEAISDGGKSLISDENLASNRFLTSLVQMSGLGEFSSIDLPKVLAGKTASTNVSIWQTTERVTGYSSTKDVETMLQLVNLRFTKPRFDESSFNVLKQNLNNDLIRKGSDLNSKMQDSVTVTLYGKNNPKNKVITKAYLAETNFDKMKAVYNKRFASPADFEFFIVGDVKQESLSPLLEKYIASIPTTDVKENWKDNEPQWVKKNIDKDIYLEMKDPKASVRMAFKNEMTYTLKDAKLMKALADILKLRLTESLREDEGGTYGAGSYASLSNEPKQEAYLSVSFDCNPDKVEQLITIVKNEIKAIENGEIKQSDLDKTLTNYLKDREEAENYNNYEMDLLKNFILEGYNMNDPKNFEEIIKAITVKDIQEITKGLMYGAQSYEIVFKPKK